MPAPRSARHPGRTLHHALVVAVCGFAAFWALRTWLDVGPRDGAAHRARTAGLLLCAGLGGTRAFWLLWAWRTRRWTEADLVPFRVLAYALGAGAVAFLVWEQPFVRDRFDVALAFALGSFVVLDSARGIARRRVPRGLRRAADLGLANLLLTAILLELGLRAAASLWPSPLLVQLDASYLQRMVCNRMEPGTVHFGFPCDARGFYDRQPKSGDRDRELVVTIGDSFSTSIVPHVYHYTTVAERSAPWCEVYNVGIPGVGPAAYLWLLRHEVLPLEPDAVVVAVFVGNDLAETTRRPPDRALRLWLDRRNVLTWSVLERLMKAARERRTLGAVAAVQGTELDGTGIAVDWLFGQQPWHADPRLEQPTFSRAAFLEIERQRAQGACAAGREQYEALFEDLRAMADACQEIPFHVVLIPDEFQVEDELWREVASPYLDRDEPQRLIGAWLGAQGIPHVDLLPVLRAVEPLADGRRHLYHLQDTHFNARGNRVAGQALAEHLTRHRRRGEPTMLLAAEEPLSIDRPGVPFALPIRVRYASGDVRALADALPAVELSTSDAAVAAVSDDGRVVATRRGNAVVEARHGSLRCTVPIEARWPSVLDLGRAASDEGAAPRLRFARGEPRSGHRIELSVEGLPAGTTGQIAVQSRPVLGGILPFDFAPYHPSATTTLPFTVTTRADGDVARVTIPLPDDPRLVDTAMFVVALVGAENAPQRVQPSNVLAVTVDARDAPR